MDKAVRQDPIFRHLANLHAEFVKALMSAPPAFREELAEFCGHTQAEADGAVVPQELKDLNAAIATFAKATHVNTERFMAENAAYAERVLGRLQKEVEEKLSAFLQSLEAEYPDLKATMERVDDDGEAKLKG